MDGCELSELVASRYSTLRELLDASQRQLKSIRAGHMSELMHILSEKQKPLNRLSQIAQRLRAAAQDDHHARRWDDDTSRNQCRQMQTDCEKLHVELLAIEAECETALEASRNSIQDEIERLDSGHQAATGYLAAATPDVGNRLDLASD